LKKRRRNGLLVGDNRKTVEKQRELNDTKDGNRGKGSHVRWTRKEMKTLGPTRIVPKVPSHLPHEKKKKKRKKEKQELPPQDQKGTGEEKVGDTSNNCWKTCRR